jgi:hypothetical protein
VGSTPTDASTSKEFIMGKILLTFFIAHFLGMTIYVTVIDQIYCQGEEYNSACYSWKGAAGLWEVVVFQEAVIRPIIKKII